MVYPACVWRSTARRIATVRTTRRYPGALLAAVAILPEEVPAYAGCDPGAFAAAIAVDSARATRPETATDDDRRHCRTCQQLAGNRCRSRRLFVLDDLPRRCGDYLPTPEDDDQRPGRDRWPWMMKTAETLQ